MDIRPHLRRPSPAARTALLGLVGCIAWLGATRAAALQDPQPQVPPELQHYVNVRSVANWSQPELIKHYPELEDLAFSESQEELPFLLEKIGEGVEAFFRDFVNTTSIERISQEVERPRAYSRVLTRRCNYLMLAHRDKKGIDLEEYRTDNKGERIDLSGTYLITSGFVSTSLYFHPLHQPGSTFRYLGTETKGRRLRIIAFAQRPETAELIGSFHMTGWTVVLLIQGIAWIDPDSHQIVRMRTDLLAPRPDILLERQTSEIELGEVRFDAAPRPLWLPRRVVVTVDWQHTVYRNEHRYSSFKLFSVETREDRKEIVRPPGEIR